MDRSQSSSSLFGQLISWILVIFLYTIDQMIRNGDVELQAREEEIRFMKMQLQEEKRSVELLKRQIPNKRNLEQELVTLQIQVTNYHGWNGEFGIDLRI